MQKFMKKSWRPVIGVTQAKLIAANWMVFVIFAEMIFDMNIT